MNSKATKKKEKGKNPKKINTSANCHYQVQTLIHAGGHSQKKCNQRAPPPPSNLTPTPKNGRNKGYLKFIIPKWDRHTKKGVEQLLMAIRGEN